MNICCKYNTWPFYVKKNNNNKTQLNRINLKYSSKKQKKILNLKQRCNIYIYIYIYVGSQIVAHTLIETGNGPNKPNTINL